VRGQEPQAESPVVAEPLESLGGTIMAEEVVDVEVMPVAMPAVAE